VQWSIDQSLKNAGLDYFDLVRELRLIAKTITPSDGGSTWYIGLTAWRMTVRNAVFIKSSLPSSARFRAENEPRPRNPDGQIKLDETGNFNDTWAEMEKVLASGKVKAIGLSNFSIKTYVYLCVVKAVL
jgi:glycerol 2-dehydrogenase (NADP+)